MSVKKITGQLICFEDALIIANHDFGAMGPSEAFTAGQRHMEFRQKFASDNLGFSDIMFTCDSEASKQGNEACFICGDEFWGDRFLLEAFGRVRDNPFDSTGYLNAVTQAEGWRAFGVVASESKVAIYILDGEVRRALDLTKSQANAFIKAIQLAQNNLGSPVIESI